RKAERQRKRLKAAESYVPTPPHITFWKQATILTADGERESWQPVKRPLATMNWEDLGDEDLDSLQPTFRTIRTSFPRFLDWWFQRPCQPICGATHPKEFESPTSRRW